MALYILFVHCDVQACVSSTHMVSGHWTQHTLHGTAVVIIIIITIITIVRPNEVYVVETRGRLAKVDGRFVHWVRLLLLLLLLLLHHYYY